ncbi:MAG: hypothetical protein Q7S24_01530 [bacterium]|nr:hypothetical protein [bacterium]
MLIEHKAFSGGNFQSVGLVPDVGLKVYTVGIGLPGEYEFVALLGAEVITIIDGVATINGTVLTVGKTIRIANGKTVRILAEEPFAYHCRFMR